MLNEASIGVLDRRYNILLYYIISYHIILCKLTSIVFIYDFMTNGRIWLFGIFDIYGGIRLACSLI